MLNHERRAWAEGHRCLVGIDEAGRGPLAGPVVAGAVYMSASFLETENLGVLVGLTDSKKLTVFQRNCFFALFQDRPEIAFAAGSASVEEVDEFNVLRATHLAMRRAVEALPLTPDHLLVDGLPVNDLPIPATAIVKGDARSLLIAAASVVAKVTRDKMMEKLSKEYPGYGLGRNKGYGTSEHIEAIRHHGPAACHRKTFSPIRQPHFDF